MVKFQSRCDQEGTSGKMENTLRYASTIWEIWHYTKSKRLEFINLFVLFLLEDRAFNMLTCVTNSLEGDLVYFPKFLGLRTTFSFFEGVSINFSKHIYEAPFEKHR